MADRELLLQLGVRRIVFDKLFQDVACLLRCVPLPFRFSDDAVMVSKGHQLPGTCATELGCRDLLHELLEDSVRPRQKYADRRTRCFIAQLDSIADEPCGSVDRLFQPRLRFITLLQRGHGRTDSGRHQDQSDKRAHFGAPGDLPLLLGDPLGVPDSPFLFLTLPRRALRLGLVAGLEVMPLRFTNDLPEPRLAEQCLHLGEAGTPVGEQLGRALPSFPVARGALEPVQQSQRVLVLR